MFDEIDFSGFAGRDEKLEKIIRYNMERRTPMFYRTNLLLHSRRVAVLLGDIMDDVTTVYGAEFNSDKALTLALVHDDAEIVTGDVQVYYKDRMSGKELDNVHENELKGIHILCSIWPSEVNGFSYKGLLLNALNKNCLEAQVVSYCDKVDAFCECLHELYACNKKFQGPAKDYIDKIRGFPVKFPSLKKLLFGKLEHSLLTFPKDLDIEKILKEGKFHTIESIGKISGISHYDRWKELTIKNFGEDVLINVKEDVKK